MPAEIKLKRLANGLQLIGEVSPKRLSAAIGFFVKTGARDESSAESGLSHFLEHMMFKGTASRSALDITYELGNLGAQANAFTSEENTVYYAAVLPEYFSRMQELLCDMLRPALDPGEFATEQKVILEEIALYQDRPHFYLMEHALKDYYGFHPAGNSVLGSTQSVSALTPALMRSYFGRRYVPANMALVASGAFDWDLFVADAERLCGGWQGNTASRTVADYERPALRTEYTKKNINQAHVLFLARGGSAQAEERHALSVLAHIIGDSDGSRLYWDLVNSGMAESAGADNDERDGTGIFVAYASTAPANIEQVSDVCRKILDTPLDFSAEELERAKTKILSSIVLHGELPMGRLMTIGSDWNYRQKVEPLAKALEEVRAINMESIEKALAAVSLKNWSEFRLLPE